MRRASLTVIAAIAALAASSGPASASAPTPPLGHEGRWITDAMGRAVILHGVNMVYKLPPYYPTAGGFGADDAAFLEDHGFNSVRLGVIYEAVEPQPGDYDTAYLDQIAATEQALAADGIFSMLDFHQDLYTEKYGGEGFPSWAAIDDHLPVQPAPGFPLTYFTSPAENQAWNNLWIDRKGPGGVGLQERYAAAWGEVASRFSTDPYVMGYDLINEPWPGAQWPTCAQPAGCPLFEQRFLGPMEDKAIAAIRAVDPTHTVWYEPSVTTQTGPKYWIPDSGDPNAGMSFHDYCVFDAVQLPVLTNLTCNKVEQITLNNAENRAAANGDTLDLSEFGATDRQPEIKRMVDRADRAMVSWQWWHYCSCSDPTTDGPGDIQAIVKDPSQPPTGDNVIHSKLDLLDRPYPQATAGTPERFFFDRGTGTFTLAYSTTAPGGGSLAPGADTRIYIPAVHYPGGYSVEVSGGTVTSAANARYLEIENDPGATEVSVKVTPQ